MDRHYYRPLQLLSCPGNVTGHGPYVARVLDEASAPVSVCCEHCAEQLSHWGYRTERLASEQKGAA